LRQDQFEAALALFQRIQQVVAANLLGREPLDGLGVAKASG
jgi:hypothetical protein